MPGPGDDSCRDVPVLQGEHEGVRGGGILAARITLTAPDPNTALDFQSPYGIEVPDGGENLDRPNLRPTVLFFASDFAFRRVGACIQQSVRLEWVGELRLRASAVGGGSATLRCDDFDCATD